MTPPRVLPPHYFLVSLLLMVALGLADTSSLLPQPWPWLGLLPVGIGIGLAIQGSRSFARAGTNIVPFTESTALVTDGVFRISRNPMYLGMALMLAGVALLLNGWLPWLVILPFVGVIRVFFIRNEERLMEQTFGAAYADYRQSVRRWI
jgi:protein-S-isoprenylcysteine O-methyltransferase Ste14